MYRKPRFLEMLHAIREEMSREADYDVDLFAEMVRSGARPKHRPERNLRGFKSRAPLETDGRVGETIASEHQKQRRRKKAAS